LHAKTVAAKFLINCCKLCSVQAVCKRVDECGSA